MRRAVGVLVRFFAGFVAGLAIVAGLGLWLLSRGPISLDAIAPYVAELLSSGNGLTVTIDHTSLILAPGGRLDVLARGVHLQREASGALVLGDLTLEFSPRTLLSGVIAPTRIVVNRPELQLNRDADGSFHLGVGELAPEAAQGWGQKLVGDLVHPPDGKGPLGSLTELLVQDASLTIDDRALGLTWHAANANALLTRASDRTAGNFRVAMAQGTNAATLDGDFTFLPENDVLVVRLAFKDLKPALWSEAAPSLAELAVLDLPISGELTAEVDPTQLTLRDAIADIAFGSGTIEHSFLAGGTLPVLRGTLQAGYDVVQGRINLGLLSIDLGTGDLGAGSASASGFIDGVSPALLSRGPSSALDASLTLAAHGLKVDDFPRLWPERAAVDTRNWVVQHLRDGTVDTIEAQLGLHVDLSPGAAKPIQIQQCDGTMSFSGLSVEYFRPLPWVKNVTGTAHLMPTEIDFTATGGDLGNIQATAATARFYKLDTNDQQAKITVAAQGPLADALALLDTPPLGYAHDIGLDPKRAAGNFVAQLDFALPLKRELPLKEVDYRAQATLSDVALGKVVLQRDLSKGALTLKLDPTAVQVDGTAELAGIPLALSWQQSLKAKAAWRTHYAVKAPLDEAQRKALGFDFLDGTLGGVVAVDATYDVTAAARAHAVASLDLKNATLDLKQINWTKAAGVPAVARVTIELARDKVTAISDATLRGNGVDAKGTMSFDDRGVSGAALDHVLVGNNDFHGSMARGANGGWRIAINGKSLDATRLLDSVSHASATDANQPPLTIDAKLDRLVLGENRVARNLTASLASDAAHWQHASIAARLSDKGTVSLSYDGAAGGRPFKLATNDFGALAKVLGIYDYIEGGQFTLDGHAVDRDGKRVLVTTADGSDFRVVRAPTLARLLSLASFSGVDALLTGQGIPFSRLEGEMDFSDGKITLDNTRAYGGAIGINEDGVIDYAAGQINVSGTIVPAYTLNSVISDIPVLGNLLVGGAGQGIFAANFRIFGPIDKPDVSVNVLSALAPGVLRNLFLFSPRGPSSPSSESQPSVDPPRP